MKARIGGWHVEADVVRDLGSNPHRVEVQIDGYGNGNKGRLTLDLAAGWAERIGSGLSAVGVLLDEFGCALKSCADADECELCGTPCDPGEAECGRCQDAEVR